MQRLSTFITEAKISQDNLNRVANIFKKRFEKKTNFKLFRFGGEKGYTEINHGIGILYFLKTRKAFRINWISGEIKSVTIWKRFHVGIHGDFTVDLGGLSLQQVEQHLIDILLAPKVGSIE